MNDIGDETEFSDQDEPVIRLPGRRSGRGSQLSNMPHPPPPLGTNSRRTINPDNRQPPKKDEPVNKPQGSNTLGQQTTQAHTLDKEKKLALNEIVTARDDALQKITQAAEKVHNEIKPATENVHEEPGPIPARQSPHVPLVFISPAGVVVVCIAVVLAVYITNSLPSSEVKDSEYKVDKLTSTMQNIDEKVEQVKKTLQGIIDGGGGGGGGGGTPAVPDIETKRKLEDVSLKVDYLTTLTAGLPQKLNTIDNTLNELDRVDGELKTMIPTIEQAKRDLVDVKSDMKRVNIDIKTHGNNIKIVEESLSSTKQSIGSKVQALGTDLGTTRRQAEDALEKVTTLQTNVETSTGDLKQEQKILSDDVAGIASLSKEQKEYIHEKIAPNTFNKHATTLVILIIIVIVVCEAFAIYILCQGQSKGHGVAQGHGRRDPVNRTRGNADNPGRARKNPILDQIQRDVALERVVCVISLEGTTRALHMDMVRSALGGMAGTARVETRDVHDVLVSSLEDIPAIPAATVNLLCIHFSERHVILEQPHLGLGDKNITTYQAVKQLGGRLAIVYVRDPGSRRLGEQELYNRDIPVQVTPELQELADQDCFFTTYDRLTPFQNTSLRRFISKYLDRR